jgi:GTP-binding protein LepA
MARSTKLNLIDTPGTSTSRTRSPGPSPRAKGALLVVDASQGVEAQTVANCYTALEQGVEVVPVLNKIDLPVRRSRARHRGDRGYRRHPRGRCVRASAKTGLGIQDILEAVIAKIPPPKGDPDGPLKALVIDSWFDNYVGVVMLVRVVDGKLRPKDRILLMASQTSYLCEQVGVFTPKSRGRWNRSRPAKWAS